MERKKPMTEAEKAAQQKKKADAFWNIFLFTKNGRLKSTRILYSFTMSVLFLALYGLCFLFIPEPIDKLLVDRIPVWLLNVIESVLPALLGTGLCLLTFFAVKTKVLVPDAYIWLAFYAIVSLLFVAIGLDAETFWIFLRVYAMIVPLPMILGIYFSRRIYRRNYYSDNDPPADTTGKRAWERK